MGVGHLSASIGGPSILFNVFGTQYIGCGGLEYVVSICFSLPTLGGIGIGLFVFDGHVEGASDRTIF